MSKFSVRISLVGAVLAAALAVGGCGNDVTVNDNISKFDASSDQMSNSAWNVPTNLVNTYVETDTGSRTVNGTTVADLPYNYGFYSSFRKIAAEGDDGDARQTIGAIEEDSFFNQALALGRDGVIYGEDGGWEVAFPVGINLNDSWVSDSNTGYDEAKYYNYNTTGPGNNQIASGGVYYQYNLTVSNVTSTIGSYSGNLNGITVALVTGVNETVGSYTGVVKIVYTTTYRATNLPVGATLKGLELFTQSTTRYWKPGVGVVKEIETGTTPNYILINPQPANTSGTYSVTGSNSYTYTYDMTSSGVPTNNG